MPVNALSATDTAGGGGGGGSDGDCLRVSSLDVDTVRNSDPQVAGVACLGKRLKSCCPLALSALT
jgi:hypothetical protein